MATRSLSTQDFFSTSLSSTIVATDTTIFLNSLPTPSEGYLVLESTSSSAREIIYYTSKGANFVTCPSVAAGRGVGGTSAAGHTTGATVEMNMTSEHWKALQDGTAIAAGAIPFDGLAANTEGEFGNNFVSTGLGITGASSSLVGSMASGVAYVAGTRVVVPATPKTYQAAADTFVDLKSDGSITYAGAVSGNSGASVPITNGAIRVAQVNTHATGINAITRIGAGRDGSVLYPRGAIYSTNITNPYKFFAYHNTTQSLADTTVVGFNTKVFDVGGVYDGVNKFTAPVAGFYQVNSVVYYQAMNALNAGSKVQLNGADFVFGSSGWNGGPNDCSSVISVQIQLNAGDTLQIVTTFTGGGSRTVYGQSNAPRHTTFGVYLVSAS